MDNLRRVNLYTGRKGNNSKRFEMASKLRCWHCGTRLQGLSLPMPMPMPRLAECPQCRVDLHVCWQCSSYDKNVLGQCRHDQAERVENKTRAIFCMYSRPSFRAFDPVRRDASHAARDELNVFTR